MMKTFRRAEFRKAALLAVLTLAAVGFFLALSARTGAIGFPLDDAWIHQTYARGLARDGRFTFIPGEVSGGSTSPLWSLLLAIGYFLRLPYLGWAYFLGAVSLFWLAWSGMQLWRILWPGGARVDWIIGVVLVLSWKLLWGAASGMETLLFAAIGLQLLVLLLRRGRTPGAPPRERSLWGLGLLTGLLILTRPDGLVLLLLLGGGLWLLSPGRFRPLLVWLGATLLVLAPYFLFNYWTSGTLWPNTFYAKQAEYAILLQRPFLGRGLQLLYFSLGGPETGWRGMSSAHLLLLPGILYFLWWWQGEGVERPWRERLLFLLPLLWAAGHVVLYAWRLPVTFQHGRYLLPAQPVWSLYGLIGWGVLLFEPSESSPIVWVIRQVAGLSFSLILLFFLGQGAAAYANDVSVIEGEMVTVAHWLQENTSPDSLIAAHDIGAIGYFTQRPLLDLAGLISPEVLPFLENEAAMATFILQSEADYLVTAPGWPYTEVAASPTFEAIFTTNFTHTTDFGLNNMTVYRRIAGK